MAVPLNQLEKIVEKDFSMHFSLNQHSNYILPTIIFDPVNNVDIINIGTISKSIFICIHIE